MRKKHNLSYFGEKNHEKRTGIKLPAKKQPKSYRTKVVIIIKKSKKERGNVCFFVLVYGVVTT